HVRGISKLRVVHQRIFQGLRKSNDRPIPPRPEASQTVNGEARSDSISTLRKALSPTTKGLRGRMRRTPAENAEGAEVYWEGEMYLHRSRFQQLPWSAETIYLKIRPKGRVQSLEPTQPDRQAGRQPHRAHRALCGKLSGSGWEKT